LQHPAFFGPRIITFSGKVLIRSQTGSNREDYAAAVNVVEAAAISAFQGILNSDSSLAWTPTGGSGKSISVRYGVDGGELQFSGNMIERSFTFSLYAANPTIS
jgi:uncharacterized protein